ncbi:hypothetical protein SEUCBS140593_004147 [Sporothrix eucalyptigena]|uniref:Uncharacterized protein n=1 Tax=Sporothrix eucalyptigena TaxID=1812306 RepID=A0ABP0BL60_9PEZI
MAAPRQARQTIRDNGPENLPATVSKGLTRAVAISKPTTSGPQMAKNHETLNLQMSLWPTFPQAMLPEIRDPGRPNYHDGVPGPYRGRRSGGLRRSERKLNILDHVEEKDQEDRLCKAKEEAEEHGEWRKMWDNILHLGHAVAQADQDDTPTYNKTTRSTKAGKKIATARKALDDEDCSECPMVLRMPHMPAPLPPCLQCALAGVCCSLTVRPYAKGFYNDRASTRPPRPAPTKIDPESTAAKYAEAVALMDEKPSDWVLATSGLPWKLQCLKERLLEEAIDRGSIDSPFLPQPPAQCVRCARSGENACLQQSRDLTNKAALAGASQTPVAWFASSGPPPLSLLPQHHISLIDQILYDARDQMHRVNLKKQQKHRPGTRMRSQKQSLTDPHPVLEAIFCRDPKALAASQIASKAQDLLAKIGQRHASTSSRFSQRRLRNAKKDLSTPGYLKGLSLNSEQQRPQDLVHVGPATKLEVSRLLPRRTWMNAYAGHGVAVAAASVVSSIGSIKKVCFAKIPRKPVPSKTNYQDVPPPLPPWFVDDPAAPADIEVPAPRRYYWQDHFLNLDEDRVAAQTQRDKPGIKRKPLPSSYAPPPPKPKPVAGESKFETKEERQARIAKMAATLDQKLRERRRVSTKVRAALQTHPSQQRRSNEESLCVADLINTISTLEPGQAHQLASLLAAPIGAIHIEDGEVQERYLEPLFF